MVLGVLIFKHIRIYLFGYNTVIPGNLSVE